MKVTINLNENIHCGETFLIVHLYETMNAYLNPIEHQNECFNSVCVIDLTDSDRIRMIKNIFNSIEICVNQLLNYKDPDPSDSLLDKADELLNKSHALSDAA